MLCKPGAHQKRHELLNRYESLAVVPQLLNLVRDGSHDLFLLVLAILQVGDHMYTDHRNHNKSAW